jgi:hypothetical protein
MGSLFSKDYQNNKMYYNNQSNNYNTNNYGYNNSSNKFNKTINDMFGLGKDLFSSYQGMEGAGGSYFPLIGGLVNSGTKALNGGSWKDDVPQAFFGIDNEKDSDTMQTLKGAGKGAMMGTAIFPGIGTAIGALLGAGASFLDDI